MFFWHDQGREPKKAQVVAADWLTPKSVKGLRSFSGFAGHYKRFVQNYAILAKPLTDLLKKGEFLWSSAVEPAFKSLKIALITAPVLGLLDFSKLFVVETNASMNGIGAVLMQEVHPSTFISRAWDPSGSSCQYIKRRS